MGTKRIDVAAPTNTKWLCVSFYQFGFIVRSFAFILLRCAYIFTNLLSQYCASNSMIKYSKGKWDPMDGADSEHLELDKDDPLYDEEAADNKYILTTAEDAIPADGEDPTLMDGITDRKVYGPMLTLAEFKLQVAEAVKEYFDASDADEVLRGINELKCRDFHPEVCPC